MADVTRERGVSTVVGYVLNVGIALLLVTGLLIAASGLVADQRARAVHAGLSVASDRLASDLVTADRLASAPNTSRATVTTSRATVTADLPRTVAGRAYTVTLATPPGGPTRLTLAATQSSVTVTRELHLDRSVANATRYGGPVRVAANATAVEVTSG